MKTLKQIFICLLIALLPVYGLAQDGRHRDYKTIVADGLAQLPIADPQKRNQVMSEMANTGAKGMELMASMLVPADKGKNAVTEYGISGVVEFVTLKENEGLRTAIREGLVNSIEACKDNANRAFLFSQLQLCSTSEDAAVFKKYLADTYLADYAIRAIVSMPNGDKTILELMQNPENLSKKTLAHAARECALTEAEPILLEWLKKADEETAKEIFKAIAVCGSSRSLKPLASAAKKEKYNWNKNNEASASYLNLLNRLATGEDSSQALKAGKKLLKNDQPYLRGAALNILMSAEGVNGISYVRSALKDPDIEVRNAALRALSPYTDENVYATVAGWYPSLSEEARIDVVNWFSSCHAASQIDIIVDAIQSESESLSIAGIKAAGRLGGEKALEALIRQLNGNHSSQAVEALLAFNGNIKAGVKNALNSDEKTQVQALRLAATRQMKDLSSQVFSLLGSANQDVRDAAYKALAGVVTLDDFDRLATLLSNVSPEYVTSIQEAMKSAIKAQSSQKQYELIAARIKQSSNQSAYYPVLAQTNTNEAIQLLKTEYSEKGQEAAFKALLQINNPQMIEVLFQIATEKEAVRGEALSRYATLVAGSSQTGIRKYQLYRQALELNPPVNVQKQILNALSSIHEFPSLLLTSKYLSNKETAPAAAAAVKAIMSKNGEQLGGTTVKAILEKAQSVYKGLSGADDGYAVDEISKLLSQLPSAEYLPLFDGTLNAWTNDKKNAWIASGSELTCEKGKTGTISTKKDYENFEMYIEWKTAGKAGIAVRSIPQIGLGTEGGSGTLLGNKINESKPQANADNKPGEWNTLYAKVVDDRVTVVLNGQTVIKNSILENSVDPAQPPFIKGKLQLIGEGDEVTFRDLYIRELPSTPVFTLSEEEQKEGYEMLFDGTSLHKWTGNTHSYITENGTIYVEAGYGSGGNLYTKKEYSDFVLRFEFCFEQEGVNNGIGIRTRMGVDAAYEGMELQLLDHDAPMYKDLHVYQQHGSVYGIIPAKRVKFGPLGTWNTEEIRAVGDHITVTVNGEVILDGNIREACQGHNVAPDGSGNNPYTVDHLNHPGLFNKKGYICFCGHGVGIRFRNVRVLDLSSQNK